MVSIKFRIATGKIHYLVTKIKVKGLFITPSSMRGSGVYYFNKLFHRTTCEVLDFSKKSRAKYKAKINTIKKERKRTRRTGESEPCCENSQILTEEEVISLGSGHKAEYTC
jgi:hypothetical protein